jgi:hypothetical protein
MYLKKSRLQTKKHPMDALEYEWSGMEEKQNAAE